MGEMLETLLIIEPVLRFGCFSFVFVALVIWETLAPRRQQVLSRWVRWPSNLAIAALNGLVVRLLLPTAAIGLAVFVDINNWGLFNQLSIPSWLAVLICVVALDLGIYLQHVLFHAVPGLWRLHRMHHADLEFDVTTGVRFHPIEILLSLGFKFVLIVGLGAPALAVLIFEVLLNATSMFNHSNVRIRFNVDRVLRWIVVTPDMHRVHHSVDPVETNSNFGFNLPWWDRLLGTYCAQPATGHDAMKIGLRSFRSANDLRLDQMLVQPWRGNIGEYSIHPEK